MSLSFAEAPRWWRELQPDPDRKHPGNRAALARLRRCASVTAAMEEPVTFDLYRRCGGAWPADLVAAALAAAVLAHVRKDEPEQRSIARRIGPTDINDPASALVKPLRFRRLMEAETEEERLIAFRRLAGITGHTLNIRDLSRALLNWSEESRRRWVYDYWNAGTPTGTGTVTSPQAEETTP